MSYHGKNNLRKVTLYGGPLDGAEIEVNSEWERMVVPRISYQGSDRLEHHHYALDEETGRFTYRREKSWLG